MKVLITGAGGQLGRDLQLHCEARGRRGGRRHPRHARRRRPRRRLPGDHRACSPTWCCTPPRTRRSTPARPTPTPPTGSTPSATRWVADASRRVGAHLVARVDRLRVRRHQGRALRRVGPAQPAVGVRPVEVGRRARDRGPRARGQPSVRTSWVCGEHGNNMVKTVLKLADRPELAFVDDQRGHPTFTADLAVGIRRLAAARVPGLFHMTNQGAVSWYEFVRRRPRVGRPRPGQGAPDQDGRPRPAPARAPSGQLGARQRRAAPGRASPAAALPREPRPPGRPPDAA